jgi:hypothetical protein
MTLCAKASRVTPWRQSEPKRFLMKLINYKSGLLGDESKKAVEHAAMRFELHSLLLYILHLPH